MVNNHRLEAVTRNQTANRDPETHRKSIEKTKRELRDVLKAIQSGVVPDARMQQVLASVTNIVNAVRVEAEADHTCHSSPFFKR